MKYAIWLSCTKFTCEITVQDHIIVQACPLLRKFIGQPVQNLRRWAAKWPPVNEAVLRDPAVGEIVIKRGSTVLGRIPPGRYMATAEITITDAMGRAAQAERSHQ